MNEIHRNQVVGKLCELQFFIYIYIYIYIYSALFLWTTRNKINDNERTKDYFIKYISHFLLERGPLFVVSWEIDGETYTQRVDFFPYVLPGARGCQRLQPLASSSETTWSATCPWLGSILCTLSKSDRMILIMWSHTPIRPECPDALPSSCLLMEMWQLAKAHGVTRNKPKIHVIFYITYIYICVYVYIPYKKNFKNYSYFLVMIFISADPIYFFKC